MKTANEYRPRVTDMRNGTFRPEVLIDDGEMGGIILGKPLRTVKAARAVAKGAAAALAATLG
jgi:hypothetical protein